MTATFTIEGNAIRDIQSFYDEINRLFMANEDWELGPSLDAFNDLLYGGIGTLEAGKPVRIVWRDIERSRLALGVEATRAHLRRKLLQPKTYDARRMAKELAALDDGSGPTYFDTIIEIFAQHLHIELVAA